MDAVDKAGGIVPPDDVKRNIDAIAAAVKSDIDTIVPPGAVIVDVSLDPVSNRGGIILDAEGNPDRANTLLTQITNNLTTAARLFTVEPRRRADDGQRLNKVILISTTTVIYRITNF